MAFVQVTVKINFFNLKIFFYILHELNNFLSHFHAQRLQLLLLSFVVVNAEIFGKIIILLL